ncbi:MAG TPA: hypothetical protein ACFCUD_13960 [Cyclobacteriaceae bacterium]
MSEFKNLDALADQLYQEGMEKAQKESERMLSDAKKNAEEEISQAKKEAEEIVSAARKEADKYRSTVESEIHQKARQAKEDLKNQIGTIIQAKILDNPIREVLSDRNFVEKLILSTLETWKDGDALELSISESMKEMEKDLKVKIHKTLPGLKITLNEYHDSGFKIENIEKGYVLSFTENDFKALFEPYLTERVRKLLFAKES